MGEYPALSLWANVITSVFTSERGGPGQGQRERSEDAMLPALKRKKGSKAKNAGCLQKQEEDRKQILP